jgi:phosphoribosylaminoimidazolecarboxamide formyltransferase/IMP cyclohydrolase
MGRIARALVSVSDKKGVVELCQALVARSVTVYSTGGTAKALRDAGVPVTDVSELTGSPEIMDGRVKTLHPRVHGGILMRDLDADRADLSRIGGVPIDLVVVNLYPFEATVARNAPHDEIIENIDIGGPCMIRASAKNHARVSVVVDPKDYDRVLASIDEPDSKLRAELALKAFAHTAAYDKAITEYLQKVQG